MSYNSVCVCVCNVSIQLADVSFRREREGEETTMDRQVIIAQQTEIHNLRVVAVSPRRLDRLAREIQPRIF